MSKIENESEQEIFNNNLKDIVKEINEIVDVDMINSMLENKDVLSIDIFSKNQVKKIAEKHNLSINSDNITYKNASKPLYNFLMQVPKISKLLVDLSIKKYNPCLSSRTVKGKSLFSKHEEIYTITLK